MPSGEVGSSGRFLFVGVAPRAGRWSRGGLVGRVGDRSELRWPAQGNEWSSSVSMRPG